MKGPKHIKNIGSHPVLLVISKGEWARAFLVNLHFRQSVQIHSVNHLRIIFGQGDIKIKMDGN